MQRMRGRATGNRSRPASVEIHLGGYEPGLIGHIVELHGRYYGRAPGSKRLKTFKKKAENSSL